MKKNDYRIYNRKTQRDLAIEMNLFCALNGKHLTVSGATFNSLPVSGTITNVVYTPGPKRNYVNVVLSNLSEYTFRVKHGKPIFNNQTKLCSPHEKKAETL